MNVIKGAAVLAATTKVNPAGYGGWAGDCPGCDKDLLSISTIVAERHRFFYSCSSLLNARATWDKFSEAIRLSAASLTTGDLLFIYRSGHGGQMPDANGDEPDGLDETLCMYDRQVSDDELWALLCDCVPEGVRVLLITDACHSETSFRSAPSPAASSSLPIADCPLPIASRPLPLAHRRLPVASSPSPVFKGSLLALSGCADNAVSWGDWRGGRFTRALLAELRPDISYTEWFWKASSRMGKSQIPKLTEVGPSFADRKALT